ncbi:MAG: tetratricopeptide repeat protein [Myxococcota bacterium]|nr:tetratricopeptide repeat protein [Myxococcota bacterium]
MRVLVSMIVALALALVPSMRAGAQALAGDSVDDAADAFARGRSAFDEARYADALTLFRRAYELAPHDRVRFNIAVCLEELRRYREAAVEFDAVAASHQLDPLTKDRARAAADAARAQLATLAVVSGTGEVLELRIDGVEACATPCEVTTDPGAHVVSYRDTRGTHERRVRVEAGGRLELALASLPAPGLADPTVPPPVSGGVDVGPLGAIGIGLVVAGVGGAVGFGVRASDLYARYEREGCSGALCEDGELSRDLANLSIAVLVSGVIAIAIDLLFVDD